MNDISFIWDYLFFPIKFMLLVKIFLLKIINSIKKFIIIPLIL